MTANNQATKSSMLRRLAGLPKFAAEDKAHTAKNLNIILPVTMALLGIRVLFALVQNSFQLGSFDDYVIVLILVLGVLWVVNRLGYATAAATLLLILTFAGMVFIASGANKIFDGAFAALFVVILLAGLLMGWKAAIVTTVLSIAAAWWLASLNGGIKITLQSNAPTDYARDVSIVLAITAVLIYLLISDLQRAVSRSQATEQAIRKQNVELQTMRTTLEQTVSERTAQLRASAEVGQVAASILDSEQLLQQTVNLIVERFGFYYAAIFTPDATGQFAVLRAGTGEDGRIMKERHHRLEIGGDAMVGRAIETRQPQVIQQVNSSVIRFANPLLSDTQAEIALPLMAGGRVLGALDVQAIRSNAFDENTTAVLQGMADQIAVALSNSTQFKETQIALQQAQHLYEASVAVAEAANPQDMLATLLAQAAPDADRGIIVLYGPRTPTGDWAYLEIAASWARHADDPIVSAGMRYTSEQLPFISRIAPTRPLIIDDATQTGIDANIRSTTDNLNVKAAIGLGLTAGNLPLGALFIAYRQPRPSISVEVRPLQTLAGQVASALYNQRLAQETQAALKQLDDLNRRLTGEAWTQYARATAETMRQIEVAPGTTPQETPAAALAQVTAPIMLRNVTIGKLQLEDPDRAWTPDDQALLEIVANELAIAVENARLIEQTERRAQREAQLNRIAQQLRQTTDIRAILQTATEQLSLALDTSHAQAQIGKQTRGEKAQ